MSISVYKLEPFYDDPRYEGFYVAGALELLRSAIHPAISSTRFRPQPYQEYVRTSLMGRWPLSVGTGRVRPFNDYPGMRYPIFSPNAVKALGDFLRPNGELLPLQTGLGEYFVYNLLTTADARDYERTKGEKGTIEHYAFHENQLIGHSIFGFIEDPIGAGVYVTDDFVARARKAGLNGMRFLKIWPLPEGSNWHQWNIQEETRLAAEKTKRGELPVDAKYLGRHSVLIHLNLEANKGKGSKIERETIDIFMDNLDHMFMTQKPDDVPVGTLAGHEYFKGECVLFLSCPDCDILVEKLRPWLANLPWPDFAVDKRYGVYTDAEAREERLTMGEFRK